MAMRYERFRVLGSEVPGSGFKGSKMVVSDIEILREKFFTTATQGSQRYIFSFAGRPAFLA